MSARGLKFLDKWVAKQLPLIARGDTAMSASVSKLLLELMRRSQGSKPISLTASRAAAQAPGGLGSLHQSVHALQDDCGTCSNGSEAGPSALPSNIVHEVVYGIANGDGCGSNAEPGGKNAYGDR